jgi:glucose/arabinose dehydrogenase
MGRCITVAGCSRRWLESPSKTARDAYGSVNGLRCGSDPGRSPRSCERRKRRIENLCPDVGGGILRGVKTDWMKRGGKLWMAVLALGLLAACGTERSERMDLELFAEGFVSPVEFVPLPDGSGRVLVADQVGKIHVVDRRGRVAEPEFLDLGLRLQQLNQGFDERGLLGLALHPRFGENGRFYIYYSAPKRRSAPEDWDHTSRVSEFRMAEGEPLRADPASERILMEIDQPYFNHNGGGLVFGPDGYLYISSGDGGNANDRGRRGPEGNGQDLGTWLGKILRIDVDGDEPYGIPADNPFQDGTVGLPEIYAFGLRNAWKISFDRGGTGELFAADVGQTMFEEVNLIVAGGNYGWNIREGFHCFDPDAPTEPPTDCPDVGARGEPLLDPILEYKNRNGFRGDPEALGISVTGGYVYRGEALPGLRGRYVFGDWSRSWGAAEGVVLVATRPAEGQGGRWTTEVLELASHPEGHIGQFLNAFGQDAGGELYVLTNGSNTPMGRTGRIYKLVRR